MAKTIHWEQILQPFDLNVGDKVWVFHRHHGQIASNIEIMDKWRKRDNQGKTPDILERIFPTYFRTDSYRSYTVEGILEQLQPLILIHKWNHALPWLHNGFEPLILLRKAEE